MNHPLTSSRSLAVSVCAAMTLSAGCGGEAPPVPDIHQQSLVAAEPGQGVGDDGLVLGSCVDGRPLNGWGERATFSLAIVANADEAHRLLSGSASGKVAFARGAVKLETRASFADDLVEKSNQLTLAIYAEVELHRQSLDPVSASFVVSPTDPRFGELCGSAGVTEVIRGGRAIAAVAYRFKSARRKTEFSAAMKAAFKKGLARAEFTAELRRVTETFSGDVDLRVSLWQDGGNAAELLTALRGNGTTPESAAEATVACGQTDPVACIDVIQRVLTYLYSDRLVQSFRERPAPIGFSTLPWSVFRQVDPVLLPNGVIRARRTLERKLEELMDLRSTLKTQRIFGTGRKDLERRLWDNETAILLAVRDCFDRIQADPSNSALHQQCETSASDGGLAALGHAAIDEQLLASDDYDAFLDFCDQQPCGAWSYLDQGPNEGAPAVSLPAVDERDGRRGYRGATGAHVIKNYGGHRIEINGETVIDRDRLYMHPGSDRAHAILRFTSPRDGDYELTFLAEGASTQGTTTNLVVRHAGMTLRELRVNGYGPFSRVGGSVRVALPRGHSVDFRVTEGGNSWLFDTTSVMVTANRL